jgi:ubiquinone biosynthesis protein UbiJ
VRNDKATFGWPFSFVLNHLLDAEPAARERLAPFAGEVIEVRAPPLPALTFTILPGGRMEAGGSPGDEKPALVVRLKPELLSALGKGEEHLMRAVEVSGNPQLAAEVMWLLRHMRAALPEIAEEDLSRVFGDVLAWQADAAGRLAGAFSDYATEEARLLVGRAEHDAFAAAVSRLRDAVERLEKRIAPLG